MWFFAYFLVHLLIYSLFRLEFLVWNWASLQQLPLNDILKAFLYGFRFDLSALSVTVGLCFLGVIWMQKTPRLRKYWFLFFIILNSIFFLINAADVELYNFTAKRFSSSAFFMIGEGKVSDLVFPYIGLASCSFALIGIYIFITYKLALKYNFHDSIKTKSILTAFIFLISVILSRGGLQHKPLTFVDAKLFNNTYANNLVLNSTFTILKSLGKTSLIRQNYFSKDEMLSLLNPQEIKTTPVVTQQPNIVLVILESFSEEYLDLKNPEATPFLNRLRKNEAYYFQKAYANGRRSIEGIAAILSGIPALMEEPFINSEFSANQIIGLGTILNSHNYHTSFFHGASNGSMHFDRFTKSVGIENYFGMSQYPDHSHFDGSWGIYDEPFLKWTCQKLSEFKTPFFSTLFTMTSHQPYKIPTEYNQKFKDDRHQILKAVRYTDFAIEEFMKCAKSQPWFQNSIFIFTADHTGPFLKNDASFESRYQIPLIIYDPQKNKIKNVDTDQYAQHIDILPTILDLLNIEYKNKNYLSRSLLRSGPKIIALYADHHYELVGNVTDADKQLKAIQQYFSEGLYDNRLYYPSK